MGGRRMAKKRKCGVLLPVSSLPSKYGIGCFDKKAYEFVDALKEAGQSYWQILPLGPTSYGDSPYQSFSTFAGNPYFITLEELVNRTNEQYREKGLALIQKIPTPITPVRMDKENRHITLAYFEQRSTVDYIGAVQGIPVCFDAKECCVKTFPLANIHPHQVAFMDEFEKQKGIAFFLIYFSADNVFYYLTLRKLKEFWKRMEDGGRKSFRREELDEKFYLSGKNGFLVPYLEGIQKDLQLRD